MRLCYWPWLHPFRVYDERVVLRPRHTSPPPPGTHLVSLRAGSSSLRKSSQPGLLLLLSISAPATAVNSLLHPSFWTSPPGLLLRVFSLVRLTPVTQHAVLAHNSSGSYEIQCLNSINYKANGWLIVLL
ncbi:hypothetical protein E2C01_062639 [Portunus trituberculatus]|uniref:Uncharacterized protein n=1 Tax=Portunus trituberculatus TaxID=210409 RepID=A0A5B7HGM4_PORTR|nr:hypothetical protein [Portunus trituberculatus]